MKMMGSLMMQPKHKSQYVAQVMREIRQAALDEENEKLRGKLWRWYYRLQHGEDEIQLMLKDTAMRNVLEFIIEYGMLPLDWKEEIAKFLARIEADEDKPPSPVIDDIDDDDIPPRQLGFWEDQSS
jgi:hypothetical protein